MQNPIKHNDEIERETADGAQWTNELFDPYISLR